MEAAVAGASKASRGTGVGRLLGLVWVLALLLTLPAPRASAQVGAQANTVENAPQLDWSHQFGSTEDDTVVKITSDSAGVYLLGKLGDRPYVRRYGAGGEVRWTRYIGSAGSHTARVMTSDSTGVYVAGVELPRGQSHAYVRKYDASGNELWTRKPYGDEWQMSEVYLLTTGPDGLYLTSRSGNTTFLLHKFDANGNELWRREGSPLSDRYIRWAMISGDSSGLYAARTVADMMMRIGKFDANGETVWERDFRPVPDRCAMPDVTPCPEEYWVEGLNWATAIAVDSTGVYAVANGQYLGKYDNSGKLLYTVDVGREATSIATNSNGVYVAGSANGDAFLKRYETGGNETGAHALGSAQGDSFRAVATTSNGVYVAGDTTGTLPGQTSAGKRDVIVARYQTRDADCNSLWTNQFGTSGHDTANATLRVTSSDVYAAGSTGGNLPGQPSEGLTDAYVRKHAANGDILWTRQFGTSAHDHAYGVASEPSGLYVAGSTGGALPGQTNAGGDDAFVSKYDFSGNLLWTRQFGGPGSDEARAVAAHSGEVYVVGRMAGHAFVRKYGASGKPLWNRQYKGSGANPDGSYAIVADSSGVHVAGETDGAMPGETSAGGRDALVRKYDHYGEVLWTRQLGTSGDDRANAIVTDSTGVYASGGTDGALPGQTSAGNQDAFVRKYDFNGSLRWTRQFGTPAGDEAFGITSDATSVYATGTTGGTLSHQRSAGARDAFVRKFGQAGRQLWTHQFGSPLDDDASAILVDSPGLYIAGSARGALPCQFSAGDADAYLSKLPLPYWLAAPYTPDLAPGSDGGASDTDDVTNDSTPTFTGFAESELTVQIRILVDGQVTGSDTVGSGGAYTVATNAIPDGTHMVTAVAVDSYGNASKPSTALSITVDTKAPTTATLDMTAESDSGRSNADNVTNDSTPTFIRVDPEATVNVRVGGLEKERVVADPDGVYTLTTALADGPHSMTVTAIDTAGNTTAAQGSLSITIDTVAPVAPSTPDLAPWSDGGISNTDNITNVNKPTFTGSAEAGTSISITAGGSHKGSGATDSTGAYRVTVGPAALADGTHSLAATSTDTAGNASSSPGTLGVKVDTRRPVVSYPVQSLVASTTLSTTSIPFKIAWSATDDSGKIGRYELERSQNSGAFTAVSLPSLGTTSIRVWLAPESANQFRVAAMDLAGNYTLFAGTKWKTGPNFKSQSHQEDSATITYTGAWTRVANTYAYGGYVKTSAQVGAKATLSFRAANIGVVMPRRSDLGVVKICLDPGTVYQKCNNVDLSPSTTKLLGPRKLVWVRNNLDPADQHTVSVTVESGRVDLDAFALAWFFSTNQ